MQISHEKISAAVVAGQPPAHADYFVPRVNVRRVVTASSVVEAAEALERAATGLEEGGLAKFADDRLASLSSSDPSGAGGPSTEEESWKLLKTLFRASAGGATTGKEKREQLVELLGGFDRDELKHRVEEAVRVLKAKLPPLPGQVKEEEGQEEETETPGTSEATTGFTKLGGAGAGESEAGESEVTEPSLFGADHSTTLNGSNNGAEDDFFGSLNSRQPPPPSALPPHLRAGGEYHHDPTAGDASIAATIGSSPSSAAGAGLKRDTFALYSSSPSSPTYENGERATDPAALVTQSLVLGDFESAVALSLSSEHYADALLFALQSGSPTLLSSTQETYFARRAASQPYLRVLEAVVGGDLSDVVQNAELENWKEVFVFACTFAATEDEFAGLVEGLGGRCELRWRVEKDRDGEGEGKAEEWRKNAVLCFLAAGRLEKVVGVWIEQMGEEEEAILASGGGESRFEAHAKALQAFVEKVQVFQHAVGYVDADLTAQQQQGGKYKLAALYDRYIEYAELLAGQGKEKLALKYVGMTPAEYEGTEGETKVARERVLKAGGGAKAVFARQQQQQQPASRFAQPQSSYGQPAYGQQSVYGQQSAYGQPAYGASAMSSYNNPYAASNSVVGAGAGSQSNPLASSTRSAYNPYAAAPPPVAAPPPANPYAAPPPPPPAAASAAVPPPRTITSPVRNNPYAPMQAMVNPLDDPYAPPPGQQQQQAPPSAQAPSNPYAPSSVVPPILTATSASGAPLNDPYAPSHNNPAIGLPQPPAIREASPDFRQPVSAFAAPPPPPRAKPEVAWNDAPILPSRKTPAPSQAQKPAVQAIASPFPNSSPIGSPGLAQGGQMGYGGQPGMTVPPPPPSRSANRTPAGGPRFAPPPPPGAASSQAPPPPPAGRILSPPPPPSSGGQGQQQQHNPYAPPPQHHQPQQQQPQSFSAAGPPPPPPQAIQRAQQQFAPPPPRSGTPSSSGQPQYAAPPPPRAGQAPPPPPGSQFNPNFNRGATATPPPGSAGFPPAPPPPRPTSAGGQRFAPPPQTSQPGQGGVVRFVSFFSFLRLRETCTDDP